MNLSYYIKIEKAVPYTKAITTIFFYYIIGQTLFYVYVTRQPF